MLRRWLSSPPSAAPRVLIRVFGLAQLVALASGCALFQPAFRAPVDPMVETPSLAHSLAEAMAPISPQPDSLNIKIDATVRGGGVRGRQGLTLYALWKGTELLKFKAVGSTFVGGLFQIVRNGPEVSVHLQKEGRFYRGAVALLKTRPDVLLGFQPEDLVRALLVETEARDALRALPADTPPPADPDSDAHWLVAEPIRDARREVYRIRKADGLVDRVTAFDALGRLRFTARYRAYTRFEGQLYPSRFELTFHDTGLHLKGELERLRVNPPMRPATFSLDAPRGLETRPLSEWLTSMSPRPIAKEEQD